MSQTFWESEVVEEQQLEQPFAEPQAEELLSPPEFQQPEPQLQEPVAEPETLAMSRDDFSALEERVVQAVNLVKRERLARAEAEAQLREQAPLVEHLQKELNALRAERDHVRQRVERLLAQLDALEL